MKIIGLLPLFAFLAASQVASAQWTLTPGHVNQGLSCAYDYCESRSSAGIPGFNIDACMNGVDAFFINLRGTLSSVALVQSLADCHEHYDGSRPYLDQAFRGSCRRGAYAAIGCVERAHLGWF